MSLWLGSRCGEAEEMEPVQGGSRPQRHVGGAGDRLRPSDELLRRGRNARKHTTALPPVLRYFSCGNHDTPSSATPRAWLPHPEGGIPHAPLRLAMQARHDYRQGRQPRRGTVADGRPLGGRLGGTGCDSPRFNRRKDLSFHERRSTSRLSCPAGFCKSAIQGGFPGTHSPHSGTPASRLSIARRSESCR